MDYARQNYVAQPGDGLKPKDFIRRLGPFDDFAINWGYRVLASEDRRATRNATLNDWITKQTVRSRTATCRKAVRQRRSALADRGHRRRSGEGDDVRAS